MLLGKSDCLKHFGWENFDPARLAKKPCQCPVQGCSSILSYVPYGDRNRRDRTLPWCQEHGIRLHSNTFAYWNGPDSFDEARLRNFIVGRDLASIIALPKGMKAESHRLGFEMSEDALSWNVFVSLAVAGKLRETAEFLTGRRICSIPHLYLWGRRIDKVHKIYEPLVRVRDNLEPDIRRFVTEPDIMLVAERELVLCIEAKFGSGNPLARDRTTKDGEKPISRAGLLDRYLGNRTSDCTRGILCAEKIGLATPCQLLRNIVFASEMAGRTPWHVINLVRRTQAKSGKYDKYYSYADPTEEVRSCLHPAWQHCFTYCTWESLHGAIVSGDPALAHLDGYLRGKSAHFRPAFVLG